MQDFMDPTGALRRRTAGQQTAPGIHVRDALANKFIGESQPTPAETPSYPGLELPMGTAVQQSADRRKSLVDAMNSAGNEPKTWQSGLSNALMGFSRGAAATPENAGYNPGAGAIIGGLAGAGQTFQAAAARRLQMQEPYRKELNAYDTKVSEKTAEHPFTVATEEQKAAISKAAEAQRNKDAMERIATNARNTAPSTMTDSEVRKETQDAQTKAFTDGGAMDPASIENRTKMYFSQRIAELKAMGVKGASGITAPPKPPAKPAPVNANPAAKYFQ